MMSGWDKNWVRISAGQNTNNENVTLFSVYTFDFCEQGRKLRSFQDSAAVNLANGILIFRFES